MSEFEPPSGSLDPENPYVKQCPACERWEFENTWNGWRCAACGYRDGPDLATEAHARGSDPATSHAAAASLTDLRASQMAVLGLLLSLGPMTDETLAGHYKRASENDELPKQSSSGLRTRRAELVDAGLVLASGRFEHLTSGRKAIVWKARVTRDLPE
jgi:hypothetical protein